MLCLYLLFQNQNPISTKQSIFIPIRQQSIRCLFVLPVSTIAVHQEPAIQSDMNIFLLSCSIMQFSRSEFDYVPYYYSYSSNNSTSCPISHSLFSNSSKYRFSH